MSAGAAQAHMHSGPNRRRAPRYPLAIPVDITVLRSGIPERIPGRSCDLSVGGLGVILPAELQPGDAVAVEFRLPEVKAALHAAAVARHQTQLRCGAEFRELSLEQQGMIRYWIRLAARASHRIPPSSESPQSPKTAKPSTLHGARTKRAAARRVVVLMASVLLVAGGLAWWRWHQGWKELESRLPGTQRALKQARTQVTGDAMQQLLTYKVEPVYPEAARQANVQGVVVLEAVIGRDGTVVDLRALGGPAVLQPAAMDAVRWWRFQPYRVNGKAVEVETTLAIEFHGD